MAQFQAETEGGGRGRIAVIAVAVAIAVTVAVGVFLVFRFVAVERDRDLQEWQIRLGIVADSRAADIGRWLERQFGELTGLAENASLQIYMTELSLAGGDRAGVTEEPAQAGYLRNLLIVTADRAGFAAEAEGPRVDANVRRIGRAGLALVDAEGRGVVATPDMPPLEGALSDFARATPRGERAVLDMARNAAGEPVMAFLVPIYAVQGERDASAQIGAVVGIKEVGPELFALLRQPGEVSASAENAILRSLGDTIEYLSPLLDGRGPLDLRLAADTPDLAAAFAIASPGGFAIRRDYRGEEVLVTGRALTTAPWTIMRKIDRSDALGDSDARLRRLLVLLLLAVGVVAVGLLAVWRHGPSRRASNVAARYEALARRYSEQESFVRLVTDSQPAAIFITDAEQRYLFANRAAAQLAGAAPEELIGKTLASVMGPDAARRYSKTNDEVLEQGVIRSGLRRLERDGAERVLRSEHIPIAATSSMSRGVLVVEQDITEAVTERERRERTLGQLIRSLVGVVDRRDPNAADHSTRVAEVARRIAREMGLDPLTVETAETAGRLMNLGKILVSEDLLTRTEGLSRAEIDLVREGIQASADLLEGIEFDGPVAETLREVQEMWDGSGGPAGLAGDGILVTARIVAVANTYVALTSPRAHRPSLGIDAAIDQLLAGVGRAFDRAVVAALVNHIENRGGREALARLVPPAA